MNTVGQGEPDRLEVVYYSQPVPRNLAVLTALGLVFDRVHFPGVYMPPTTLDEKPVIAEIQRIVGLGRQDPNTRQMLQCMDFATVRKHIPDFCVFSGEPGGVERFEPGVHEVVDELENMVFGPRPEGEIAIHTGPWVKGLPGPHDVLEFQVSAPDSITYPANALLFAARSGLPLINDVSGMPVPGFPEVDPKANARLLATILTMESVNLVLPKIAPLEPAALGDFREQLAPHLKPFRVAMLKLAKDLNAAIEAGASLTEVQKQAKFLVETEVYPKLAELDAAIKDPAKHWYRRMIDIAKAVPELAANFLTMPRSLAIAKFLGNAASVLGDTRDSQLSREQQTTRSGLYYLLKLRKAGKD